MNALEMSIYPCNYDKCFGYVGNIFCYSESELMLLSNILIYKHAYEELVLAVLLGIYQLWELSAHLVLPIIRWVVSCSTIFGGLFLVFLMLLC